MKVHDYKADCVLQLNGGKMPGLAHVVEVSYSDRIRFLNFVMQVTDLAGGDLTPVTEAGLILPDGRQAPVRISHFKVETGYMEFAGTGNVGNPA